MNTSIPFQFSKVFVALIFLILFYPGITVSQDFADLNDVKGRAVFHNLNIAPNPFSDELKISYDLYEDNQVYLEVYNALGQRVFEYNRSPIVQYAGPYLLSISLQEGINSGIYFVRLTSVGTGSITKRVMAK